jgi:hypothetical protein
MDDESRFLQHDHCRQMSRASSDEILIKVPPAIAMGGAMPMVFLSVQRASVINEPSCAARCNGTFFPNRILNALIYILSSSSADSLAGLIVHMDNATCHMSRSSHD